MLCYSNIAKETKERKEGSPQREETGVKRIHCA